MFPQCWQDAWYDRSVGRMPGTQMTVELLSLQHITPNHAQRKDDGAINLLNMIALPLCLSMLIPKATLTCLICYFVGIVFIACRY